MKSIFTLLLSAALVSSALAGATTTYSGKSGKVVQPMAQAGCDCFAPGAAFGVFGGGIFPKEDGADAAGGGVLFDYFFTEYIGFQGSYGLFATSSEHHQFDGSLVLRAPITSLCVAPYMMGGAGMSVNGDNNTDYHLGAGIEARFASMDCMGLFVDGTYHFAANDQDSDFTVGRVGVKFRF